MEQSRCLRSRAGAGSCLGTQHTLAERCNVEYLVSLDRERYIPLSVHRGMRRTGLRLASIRSTTSHTIPFQDKREGANIWRAPVSRSQEHILGSDYPGSQAGHDLEVPGSSYRQGLHHASTAFPSAQSHHATPSSRQLAQHRKHSH